MVWCAVCTASHRTCHCLQALTYAKDRGALCIGITNTVGSAIARTTHCGVHINAGCEIGVASTKAYTSQMVAITMMALALSEDSIAKRPKRDAIIDALGALPDALRKVRSLLWPKECVTKWPNRKPSLLCWRLCMCQKQAVGGPLNYSSDLVHCGLCSCLLFAALPVVSTHDSWTSVLYALCRTSCISGKPRAEAGTVLAWRHAAWKKAAAS